MSRKTLSLLLKVGERSVLCSDSVAFFRTGVYSDPIIYFQLIFVSLCVIVVKECRCTSIVVM